ncbi:hypothetical protein JX265_005768 [Neoarthrinium moseri]|uniref:Uncharacterized protein n=1 Tax=Neoarthrinium moseri TaxID=1658444 RepID=A0A9Q0AMJ0_9PEZI|nr:hypothetical protein JX266_012525 [Neoarthrinium moseri]KAI1871782.1 hypothetical protein JX265_005768 [Neoarthrinium moseri]
MSTKANINWSMIAKITHDMSNVMEIFEENIASTSTGEKDMLLLARSFLTFSDTFRDIVFAEQSHLEHLFNEFGNGLKNAKQQTYDSYNGSKKDWEKHVENKKRLCETVAMAMRDLERSIRVLMRSMEGQVAINAPVYFPKQISDSQSDID